MAKPKVTKRSSYQVGKSNRIEDEMRSALPPGHRISSTGHPYMETRKNRSDLHNRI